MMSMAMPSLEFLVWEKETPRVVMVVSASPKAEVEREYTRKRDKVNMPFIKENVGLNTRSKAERGS